MTIKTVFFDMGGTIDTYWYSPEMRLQVTPKLQAYMSSCGVSVPFSSVQLYEMITKGLTRYHQWRMTSLEELPARKVWRDFIFAGCASDYPQLESIGEDLMVWLETNYFQRQMRPEIPSVLQAIHSMGYKIGLISNVNSRGQVPLNLTQYGIINYFNPIVLSSEYTRRKPDPAIFHHAARLSNTPTSECIFIGDRISRDVLGARRAGFKLAIQIRHNFNNGESDDGVTPDFILSDMHELLTLLEQDQHAKNKGPMEKPPSRKVKAVLFDADGVLYYRKNKDIESNTFIKKHGNRLPGDLEPEISPIRHQAFIGQLSFEQYKTAVFNLCGITNPALVSQGIAIGLKEKENIHFFDHVLETLNILKTRGLYLGIITDTVQPLYIKLGKLERGGFGHVWDSIIPSNEVGVQKPDPRIYQLALQQLGIGADQAIFVGHKTSELDGARNVGMQTVAFNHDPDASADFFIDQFSDLAGLPILT